ncbi:hypothetical protein NAEGRDRAFT_78414 [Naegleria gruberi]|uniref:Teneurin NHL domain-containing protein n=1 Tax=Naegleria gruberi TaxID=5762 RepID=D2V3I9_NAEGR|nr:uncharacterized protein NAEGRDRAFT_78414 [Naegleria gruberi]EFC48645.1 hypothetical protein NAEGRDRAFT_78414 [Naegleria gruberi]|eukprot:XP_002681389.1 hypothetical protein NAEGRDRAFT_78414 [Naegleria gruberi strain NEG-M]
MSTFIGGGTSPITNGILTTNATLSRPSGLALYRGEVYLVDSARILKVNNHNNSLTIIADVNAMLNNPFGICLNDEGEIFIVERASHVVRKILTNGTIIVFAGIVNQQGYSGDGGLAVNAALNWPYDVACDLKTGDVYISDNENQLIRKVFKNGTITTIAGSRSGGTTQDGSLATQTVINRPMMMSLSSNGNLYFTSNICTIRKISTNQTISTVAGDGQNNNYRKNDILATLVTLDVPFGVDEGPFGELYIAETYLSAIRKVSPNGIISKIAGTFQSGVSLNTVLDASKAQITDPYDVIVDPSTGIVYFSEYSSDVKRVAKLEPYCTFPFELINGTCTYSCYGIGYDDARVCAGHGICLSNNTCQCESGWKGNNQCSLPSCELLNNCTGNGMCISNNTCECNSKWKHIDCSISICIPYLNLNSQLQCSQDLNSQLLTFNELQSNINLNPINLNENQQITFILGNNFTNNLENSKYFISSSISQSNLQFYSNVTNLVLQNSNSTFIQLQLSNSIQFHFKNIDIELSSFNYTCLRYDYLLNRWTNESISTIIDLSVNEITCSTNYLSTSIVIQRYRIIEVVPSKSNVIPKVSNSNGGTVVNPKESNRGIISHAIRLVGSTTLTVVIMMIFNIL